MPNEKDKQTGKQKLKWHHFDLGDSTTGQVGVSGEVLATSRDQAARQLQERLGLMDHTIRVLQGDVDLVLCINPKRITRGDFNTSRPVEDESNG